MKRGKDRDLLIEYLKIYVPLLLNNKKMLEEVSSHLDEVHGIEKGFLLYFLSDFKILSDQEDSIIGLIAEQISLKIPESQKYLNIEEWFNAYEIKAMHNYVYISPISYDEITLPYTFEDVTDLGDGVFCVPVENSVIARLRKYHLLNYNFDNQREAKLIRVGDTFKKVMNIFYRNIEEMIDLILRRKLVKTALAYNCVVDSSKGDMGEFTYNEKDKTLTVHEGTKIDVIDGAHRTIAFYEAYKANPDIKGKTVVFFTNYTPKQARTYQAQLAKQTPISKQRAEQLEEDSHTITLINRLNSEGVLQDRISLDDRYGSIGDSFVSQTDLKNGFNEFWKPSTHKEISVIMEAFNEYLEEYSAYYNSFTKEDRDKLELFNRRMFIGNIILARKMFEDDIPFEKLPEFLNNYTAEDNTKLLEFKEKIAKNKNAKRTYKEMVTFFESLIR